MKIVTTEMLLRAGLPKPDFSKNSAPALVFKTDSGLMARRILRTEKLLGHIPGRSCNLYMDAYLEQYTLSTSYYEFNFTTYERVS